MEITVRQLINRKGNTVWSTQADATVVAALLLMAEKGIGALLVFEQDNLVGIFSERDCARKVILKGKSSSNPAVGEIIQKGPGGAP